MYVSVQQKFQFFYFIFFYTSQRASLLNYYKGKGGKMPVCIMYGTYVLVCSRLGIEYVHNNILVWKPLDYV